MTECFSEGQTSSYMSLAPKQNIYNYFSWISGKTQCWVSGAEARYPVKYYIRFIPIIYLISAGGYNEQGFSRVSSHCAFSLTTNNNLFLLSISRIVKIIFADFMVTKKEICSLYIVSDYLSKLLNDFAKCLVENFSQS